MERKYKYVTWYTIDGQRKSVEHNGDLMFAIADNENAIYVKVRGRGFVVETSRGAYLVTKIRTSRK